MILTYYSRANLQGEHRELSWENVVHLFSNHLIRPTNDQTKDGLKLKKLDLPGVVFGAVKDCTPRYLFLELNDEQRYRHSLEKRRIYSLEHVEAAVFDFDGYGREEVFDAIECWRDYEWLLSTSYSNGASSTQGEYRAHLILPFEKPLSYKHKEYILFWDSLNAEVRNLADPLFMYPWHHVTLPATWDKSLQHAEVIRNKGRFFDRLPSDVGGEHGSTEHQPKSGEPQAPLQRFRS